MDKVGRNDPCPCGSGKKYKKCCETNTARKKFHAEVISSGAAQAPAAQGAKKVSLSLFQRAVQTPVVSKPQESDEPKNPTV